MLRSVNPRLREVGKIHHSSVEFIVDNNSYHSKFEMCSCKGPAKKIRRLRIDIKVGTVAYKLYLLEELDGVHDTFHVSNLKKCLADPTLQVPLDEIRVDNKLNFVEEPIRGINKWYQKPGALTNFDIGTLELENSQTSALAKLPKLKLESNGSLKMTVPSTAEEKICKKNDVKGSKSSAHTARSQ
ncbi:hypothetical protein Tco_1352266 [Tanacetum coccineum]